MGNENPRPYRSMVYNRHGNLAYVTELNMPLAERYMSLTDMRRHIIITDSDKRPESQTTKVSSDTLAFKSVEPISKLTEIRFSPKPYHTLTCQEDKFEIQVHHKLIDDHVRSGNYKDYGKEYLMQLNKTIKKGLLESLFHEKLGWKDQHQNYLLYGMFGSVLGPAFADQAMRIGVDPRDFASLSVLYLIVNYLSLNSSFNLAKRGENPYPPRIRRNLSELWLPLIPVEKAGLGTAFLLRHGKNLIKERK